MVLKQHPWLKKIYSSNFFGESLRLYGERKSAGRFWCVPETISSNQTPKGSFEIFHVQVQNPKRGILKAKMKWKCGWEQEYLLALVRAGARGVATFEGSRSDGRIQSVRVSLGWLSGKQSCNSCNRPSSGCAPEQNQKHPASCSGVLLAFFEVHRYEPSAFQKTRFKSVGDPAFQAVTPWLWNALPPVPGDELRWVL